MQGVFDYFYVTTAEDQLTINNIGDCALEAFNDDGSCMYLIIKTNDLGITRVFEYGPIKPGSDILCKNTICNFKRLEYSDSKIDKIIKNFLNQPHRNITQAREISVEDVFKNCINIVDYMKEGNY